MWGGGWGNSGDSWGGVGCPRVGARSTGEAGGGEAQTSALVISGKEYALGRGICPSTPPGLSLSRRRLMESRRRFSRRREDRSPSITRLDLRIPPWPALPAFRPPRLPVSTVVSWGLPCALEISSGLIAGSMDFEVGPRGDEPILPTRLSRVAADEGPAWSGSNCGEKLRWRGCSFGGVEKAKASSGRFKAAWTGDEGDAVIVPAIPRPGEVFTSICAAGACA